MVRSDSLMPGIGGSKIWEDATSEPRRPPIAEHAMVTLSHPVELNDGRSLPTGTRGAVVFVHGEGEAYMVEFSKPFHAVATIPAAGLSQAAQG